MSLSDKINKMLWGGTSFTGIMGVVGMTTIWLESGFEPPLLIAYTLFGGLSYFGVKNYKAIDRKIQLRLEQKTEQDILRMAALSSGKLTITEVAIRLSISVDEAKNTLESLSKKGAMEVEVSPNGGIVYALSNFLSPDEKNKTYKIS